VLLNAYFLRSACFTDVTSATITWDAVRLLGISNWSSFHHCPTECIISSLIFLRLKLFALCFGGPRYLLDRRLDEQAVVLVTSEKRKILISIPEREPWQPTLLIIADRDIYIVVCRGACVTYRRVLDWMNWIYYYPIHTTRNYTQLQRYRYFHILQFTVIHALAFCLH
jgi:hypothetical protein